MPDASAGASAIMSLAIAFTVATLACPTLGPGERDGRGLDRKDRR